MRNTPDGDGTLLDHSLLMIGGGMSDGNIHSHMDVPIALVGGAGGCKGNRHVATTMGTPLSNLLLHRGQQGRHPGRTASATAPGTLDLEAPSRPDVKPRSVVGRRSGFESGGPCR